MQLAGWVHRRRDLGGLFFLDLRDRSGIVQISCGPDWTSSDSMGQVRELGGETVIQVEGVVKARPAEAENPDMATGGVEVQATEVRVLAPSETPPIPVAYGPEEELAAEELRLRYRYLDLRRRELQRNLRLRHRMLATVRATLDGRGFVEVETPLLTKPTPEGARDYLAPSRVHRGEFYALPQSPQLYKQMLMVAGYDRYFQIARCLRDEDLRADRQPEFTQIDVEMSFVSEDDVFATGEVVMADVWEACLDHPVATPFPRLTYREALARFGTDRPDLRVPWELCDLTEIGEQSEFRIFRTAAEEGNRIRGLRVPGGAELSRKVLDGLDDVAREAGAPGTLWTRVADDGLKGGFGGRLTETEASALRERCEARAGDLILIVAGPGRIVNAALSALRRHVAAEMGAVEDGYRFVWVTGFPLLEPDPQTGDPVPTRHPFTAPVAQDVERLEEEPAAVRLRAYDLVCNGVELGSGSIRINEPELQRRVFRAIGMSAEEADRKFGFMLEAFRFGAPPHGGFALGVDRIAMILTACRSLRDVIAFPKTTAARGLMEGTPAPVPDEELEELGIRVVKRAHA